MLISVNHCYCGYTVDTDVVRALYQANIWTTCHMLCFKLVPKTPQLPFSTQTLLGMVLFCGTAGFLPLSLREAQSKPSFFRFVLKLLR